MIINVLEYLEASSKKSPDKIAFSDQNHHITYAELRTQARVLGSAISKTLSGKTKLPVVVITKREISTIISFLGVLYSGNFYVPIDQDMPAKRVQLIKETVKPVLVIAAEEHQDLLSASFKGLPTVNMEQLVDGIEDEECLDRVQRNHIDSDPIYVIFTSGSTGIPKGVTISHRSVICLIENYIKVFGFSKHNIFGNQSPMDYTGLVNSLYTTLKTGAEMHLIPKHLFSFPLRLVEHLNERGINTIIWTTSALRIIAQQKTFESIKPKYLERIFFTGEVMPNKILNYLRMHLPQSEFYNLYGSTETTCNCSYYHVDRQFKDDDFLPIGRAFPNSELFLLDEDNKVIKNYEEIGEICVRGAALAIGYFNNSKETNRTFINNVNNESFPERIFRTGDLGKFNRFGELIYINRKDNQIKHMGYRIELGEIDTAVNALVEVELACTLFEEATGKIVLCYQSENQIDKEILIKLRDKLPKYMLPNKFLYFKKIPLTNSGKINKPALLADLERKL